MKMTWATMPPYSAKSWNTITDMTEGVIGSLTDTTKERKREKRIEKKVLKGRR